MERPKDVKGIIIPTAMINNVIPITGHVARLCMNGIFRVRIMWTIKVCDNSPSTNYPV